MSKTHSPGPWRVDRFWGSSYIEDANGRTIIYEFAGGETKEADAALIAAAPELLEIVKKYADDVYEYGDRDYYASLITLIAKAEGNVKTETV